MVAPIRRALPLLLLFLASCTGPRVAAPAKSSPPPPDRGSIAALPEGHEDLLWVPQEAGRLQTAAATRFAAARESSWNRKPHEAAEAFASLLESPAPAPAPSTNQLRNLVLLSHEANGDWAGSLPWYGRFGLAETHPYRRQFAQTMAALPHRTLEWDATDAAIPFDLHRDHLVIIDARMQGRAVRLLVDTGFTSSFVVDRFATSNGVQTMQAYIRLSDANSSHSRGQLGRLDLLEVGPLTVRHLPVVIAPPRLLQRVAGPIDGVLGWDVLRHLEVTWDFPARQMFLRPTPANPPEGEPNLSGSELPIVTVVGPTGYPLNLFLDTGLASHRAQLDLNAGVLASRLDLHTFHRSIRPQFSLGMHSIHIDWPRRTQPFAFHADGYRFELAGAVLSKGLHVREGLVAIDGTIGNAPFLSGRLTLDATHRRLHWEPGGRGPVPSP